ncbi:MAG TPA: maleylpyruvate isomerase family mycothiol-dependent enzyme [Candidatus Dormibacteraeota bacterium]|jgi:maleylpyruvate isomerase|nr:maleylpyruvate isomerase family mycothiol-dependent enzyme [Candidatus Dormibacteraeota bacterium]
MNPESATIPGSAELLDWVDAAQAEVERRAAALTDAEAAGPSLLPGWTRGHVLSHLARNAEAILNLCSWARTGTPTPMYPSREVRDGDIEAGSGRGIDELRADLAATAERLRTATRELRPTDWEATVRTNSGREIPAAAILWMRIRELWIHLVDLDIGAGPEVMPDAVALPFLGELAQWADGHVTQRVELRGPGFMYAVGGSPTDAPVRITGRAQPVVFWLIGRTAGAGLEVESGGLPELPSWL